ncbi:MAG TPA: rhodanese-like domain-containing protein [Chitinophagaceae bacterium]|nr:rhodanese-like domain-containing protein [Chitinophagaceae bacterium]
MQNQFDFFQAKLTNEMDPSDLADRLNEENQNGLIVIDARPKEAFEAEHIPGALSFSHQTMNEKTVESLRKDILYVIYCDGIGCNGSTKGCMKMIKLGFKVKELIGGLEWWKKDGFSTKGTAGKKRQFDIHCNC